MELCFALALSYTASIGLSLWDLRQHAGLHYELPSRRDFLDVVDYGRKYYVARVGAIIDPQLGILFLAILATPHEIGLFAAACAIVLRTLLLSESIEASLLPRVAADPSGIPEFVGQCARILAMILGGGLLVLVVMSDLIVRTLLSEAFLPAVPLLWILAPGVFLHGTSKILMVYFRGRNRPEICSWVVWIGLSANLVMLVLLYPTLGLHAAAWAMSIGFVVRSLVLAVAFSRVSGNSFRMTWLPRAADLSLLSRSVQQMFERFASGGGWFARA